MIRRKRPLEELTFVHAGSPQVVPPESQSFLILISNQTVACLHQSGPRIGTGLKSL